MLRVNVFDYNMCKMFCCLLPCVVSSFVIISLGNREMIALL